MVMVIQNIIKDIIKFCTFVLQHPVWESLQMLTHQPSHQIPWHGDYDDDGDDEDNANFYDKVGNNDNERNHIIFTISHLRLVPSNGTSISGWNVIFIITMLILIIVFIGIEGWGWWMTRIRRLAGLVGKGGLHVFAAIQCNAILLHRHHH